MVAAEKGQKVAMGRVRGAAATLRGGTEVAVPLQVEERAGEREYQQVFLNRGGEGECVAFPSVLQTKNLVIVTCNSGLC